MLYNGDRRWRPATAIEELARAPTEWELGPYQLAGRFLLFDLSQIPEPTIEARTAANPHLRLGLLTLEHIRDRAAWKRFLGWAPTLREVHAMPSGDDRVQGVLRYLFRAALPPSPEERRRVVKLVPKL